jgi:hypothetical protein
MRSSENTRPLKQLTSTKLTNSFAQKSVEHLSNRVLKISLLAAPSSIKLRDFTPCQTPLIILDELRDLSDLIESKQLNILNFSSLTVISKNSPNGSK